MAKLAKMGVELLTTPTQPKHPMITSVLASLIIDRHVRRVERLGKLSEEKGRR